MLIKKFDSTRRKDGRPFFSIFAHVKIYFCTRTVLLV